MFVLQYSHDTSHLSYYLYLYTFALFYFLSPSPPESHLLTHHLLLTLLLLLSYSISIKDCHIEKLTMASEFAFFPLLPTELRWLIWEACIPHRNVELELPMRIDSDDTTGGDCELRSTLLRNLQPPLITKVCRESRKIAFKNGEIRHHTFITPTASFPRRISYWFSTKYDSHVLYRTIAEGPNRERFIWNKIPQLNAQDTQNWYIGRFPSYSDDSLYRFLDAGHYPEFPQQTVCLRVFVLHMNASGASDPRLWGTTGEEIVKFVDSRDIDGIKSFRRKMKGDDPNIRFVDAMLNHEEFIVHLKRWEQHFKAEWLHYHWLILNMRREWTPDQARDLLRGPRFNENGDMMMINPTTHVSVEYFQENDDQWSDQRCCLNVDHPRVQLALERAPEYRSAVMFRLCTSDCSPTRPSSLNRSRI